MRDRRTRLRPAWRVAATIAVVALLSWSAGIAATFSPTPYGAAAAVRTFEVGAVMAWAPVPPVDVVGIVRSAAGEDWALIEYNSWRRFPPWHASRVDETIVLRRPPGRRWRFVDGSSTFILEGSPEIPADVAARFESLRRARVGSR